MATYEFDDALQAEILSLCMWDGDALKRTEGLIKPEYFDNPIQVKLCEMALDYYGIYKDAPTKIAWTELVRLGMKTKSIREDQLRGVIETIQAGDKFVVRDRAFLLDHIAEFSKQQAITNALMASAKLMTRPSDKDRFVKSEDLLREAFAVALTDDDEDYDYFDRIEERTEFRKGIAAGTIAKTGITTGCKELDMMLCNGGLGRSELTFIMGGAKSTKSFFVGGVAASAVMAGHNVLFITLENSLKVASNRIDAMLSRVGMDEMLSRPTAMEVGVKAAMARTPGKLKMRWAPTGTLTPAKVQRWIDEYKTKGIKFKLVVVDYVQLMAPNVRTKDPIENSKSIATDLRAICQTEDAAGLSPIQGNRTGHASATLKAEHVSEDFNLIRLADTVLGINRTDSEKADGHARITFIASRNEPDGGTLFVRQNLNMGMAIESVESVE